MFGRRKKEEAIAKAAQEAYRHQESMIRAIADTARNIRNFSKIAKVEAMQVESVEMIPARTNKTIFIIHKN